MDGSITSPTGDESAVRKTAPYLFLGQTTSLCETCLELVPAKIISEGAESSRNLWVGGDPLIVDIKEARRFCPMAFGERNLCNEHVAVMREKHGGEIVPTKI